MSKNKNCKRQLDLNRLKSHLWVYVIMLFTKSWLDWVFVLYVHSRLEHLPGLRTLCQHVGRVIYTYNFQSWGQSPWLRGIICAHHRPAAGLTHKHTIYAFFNFYYWNFNQYRTEINEKRLGLAHLKNLESWSSLKAFMLHDYQENKKNVRRVFEFVWNFPPICTSLEAYGRISTHQSILR